MSVPTPAIDEESDLDIALEQDHYSERLANVNEDHKVVATQDIHNAHGVLLVKQGACIDRAKSEQIIKHKLTKPLAEQVKIENQIDGSGLGQHANDLFDKYPDLRTFHDAVGLEPMWRLLTEQYPLPTVLWQKLTVLQHQMPQEYEKSIFCAWLSVMIGREMGLGEDKIESLYLAGLAHDAGLLHIDPSILNKKGPLDAAEWRAIQCHVVVGQMMMDSMPGVNPEVGQAILEHHERCDGTGYPAKKSDRHLKELGLIVGMADALQAIRVKQFEPFGRTMIDAMPLLRMNANTFSYPVFQSMVRLLQMSRLQPTLKNPSKDGKTFLNDILERANNLKLIMDQLEKLHSTLLDSATTLRGQDLLRALERMQFMALRSGLLKEELLSWLRSVEDIPEQSILGELIELDLMLNELKWQLRNLLHAFNQFLEHDCQSGEGACSMAKAAMETMLAKM